MSKSFIVLCLLFLPALSVLSQSISGVVYDQSTGETLPFATIAIVGQYKGTVSNIEGRFVLDTRSTTSMDSIVVSYVGYESFRKSMDELISSPDIFLKAATINLQEINIYSKELSPKDIVDLVYENFPKNHPSLAHRQKVFFHKFEKTPFTDKNKIELKKTDFPGLDEKTFNELFDMIPDELIEYRDAQVELYVKDGKSKLIPVEGISMEEGSQKGLQKEMEEKLAVFMNDLEKTKENEDVYYKFRSGVFAGKADMGGESDSVDLAGEKDSLNYHLSCEYLKWGILNLMKDYAGVESKNLSFINSSGKYNYELDDITVFNEQIVYKISFVSKGNAPYEGVMYVTTDTYAVLKLDYQFVKGKQTEKVQLLGIGHSMDYKKGSVLFEKRDTSYFVKYIYAEQHESISIERKLSLMKKQKRFLFDKELNEFKIDMNLSLKPQGYYELLVLDRDPIDDEIFENIEQPKKMLFRKKYAYSPDDWSNSTVIAPTSELEKYKRKEDSH